MVAFGGVMGFPSPILSGANLAAAFIDGHVDGKPMKYEMKTASAVTLELCL